MDVVVVQGEREKLDTGSIPLYSVNTEGDTSRRYFDYVCIPITIICFTC